MTPCAPVDPVCHQLVLTPPFCEHAPPAGQPASQPAGQRASSARAVTDVSRARALGRACG
jgi:hypothetical protein